MKQKNQALKNENQLLEKQVNDLKKDSINAAVRDSNGDQGQIKKLKELQKDNELLDEKYKALEDQLEIINQNATKRQKEFER